MEAARRRQAQARVLLMKTIDCLTDVLQSRGSDKRAIEEAVADLQVKLDVLEEVQSAVELELENELDLDKEIEEAWEYLGKAADVHKDAKRRLAKLKTEESQKTYTSKVKLECDGTVTLQVQIYGQIGPRSSGKNVQDDQKETNLNGHKIETAKSKGELEQSLQKEQNSLVEKMEYYQRVS